MQVIAWAGFRHHDTEIRRVQLSLRIYWTLAYKKYWTTLVLSFLSFMHSMYFLINYYIQVRIFQELCSLSEKVLKCGHCTWTEARYHYLGELQGGSKWDFQWRSDGIGRTLFRGEVRYFGLDRSILALEATRPHTENHSIEVQLLDLDHWEAEACSRSDMKKRNSRAVYLLRWPRIRRHTLDVDMRSTGD